MPIYAPQIHRKAASEVLPASVNWTGLLEPSDTLTGTPTTSVASIPAGSTDLTVGTVTVNGSALVVEGTTVAIGKATQCQVSGGTAGLRYAVTITATTTAGFTRTRAIRVDVE